LRPDEDIEIRFSGIRPGEKLFEELSTDAEHAEKTRHPKIFIGRIKPHSIEEITARIDAMLSQADSVTHDVIKTALGELVPEYRDARPSNTRITSPTGEPKLTASEADAIVSRKSGSAKSVSN
jgi:FlaA1/EpsC-like NDP-sugar epimerase